MTSAFRGTDAAIVAFISAVVSQATNQDRPVLPSLGGHFTGDVRTRGLNPHSYSAADIGRHPVIDPRPNRNTEPSTSATP